MTSPLHNILIQMAKEKRSHETTTLSPREESEFAAWAKKHGVGDPDDPEQFYDYRGAFRAGVKPEVSTVDNQPHWPDTFKRHGHPTFSRESKYSTGKGDGGTWGGADGETFRAPVRADSLKMLDMLLRRGK